MIPSFPLIRRLMNVWQCFGPRRYGYLDHSLCRIPEGNEALFIVLSPDLYQITVVSLPVATAEEAIRYAPAYFEGSDDRIRYGAFSLDEGRYLLSACDPELIRSRLEASGIDPTSVGRFVLAQEAFGNDLLPIALGDGSALALSDGVVVRLPSHYLTKPPHNDLAESLTKLLPCLSGFAADMHKWGAATKRTLTITVILASVITLNLIIQGALSYGEGKRIMEEQEQMKTDKHLPSTQMELDAIAASWEKKESEQIKLRKIIASFATLSLERNTTVSLPPLSLPPLLTPSQNSIVLVPGSNPSERNLLLVPGDSNASVGSIFDEYATSLVYENGLISFKILTPSQERATKIRDIAAKTLKTNTVTVKDNSVEGSVQ